jgi:hypothetical protein
LIPIMIFMTRYYHSPELPYRINSVYHSFFSIFRLTVIALVVFFVSSCEKDGPTKIGNDYLPVSDFVIIKSIDTLSVWSYTMYDNYFHTDNPSTTFLGHIYDPYFGTTSAEFVSQVRLYPAWDHVPFFIDSVKLYLRFLDVMGGSNVTHFLRMSEISELIFPDSAYYSNKHVDTTGYGITVELPVLKPDTINEIELTLPNEFGEYITRDTSQLFYSPNMVHFSYAKPDFRSYFKGLYFRMYSSSDPTLVSLYLEPSSSSNTDHSESQNYFVIFMHDNSFTQKVLYLILDANNRNAAYIRFSHDFSTANPDKRIQHINDGYKDTLSYLQYLNGVYTKIVLPGLESLKKDPFYKKIAINKARLTVPIHFDGDLYIPSTAPTQLFLRYKSIAGYKDIVRDYTISSSFFGGKIDTTAYVYTFNIPAFVKDYLEDATNTIKPEIEIFQGTTGTTNLILKANNNKSPVKFDFSYTKF